MKFHLVIVVFFLPSIVTVSIIVVSTVSVAFIIVFVAVAIVVAVAVGVAIVVSIVVLIDKVVVVPLIESINVIVVTGSRFVIVRFVVGRVVVVRALPLFADTAVPRSVRFCGGTGSEASQGATPLFANSSDHSRAHRGHLASCQRPRASSVCS